MPAIVANASNFLLNSDFPVDKIVIIKTGTMSINNTDTTIAHGLAFTPLVGGCWSYTSDFAVSYPFGTGEFPSGNPTYPFAHMISANVDATNITLHGLDVPGTAPTAYYRLYGLETSDSTATISPVVGLGDSFVLNTDYNYMKLYVEGTSVPGASTPITVTHNLGYKPRVDAWITYTGISQPLDFADTTGSLEVTNTQIIFTNNFGVSISRFDYRIYLDA